MFSLVTAEEVILTGSTPASYSISFLCKHSYASLYTNSANGANSATIDCIQEVDVVIMTSLVGLWTAVMKPRVRQHHLGIFGSDHIWSVEE